MLLKTEVVDNFKGSEVSYDIILVTRSKYGGLVL